MASSVDKCLDKYTDCLTNITNSKLSDEKKEEIKKDLARALTAIYSEEWQDVFLWYVKKYNDLAENAWMLWFVA